MCAHRCAELEFIQVQSTLFKLNQLDWTLSWIVELYASDYVLKFLKFHLAQLNEFYLEGEIPGSTNS